MDLPPVSVIILKIFYFYFWLLARNVKTDEITLPEKILINTSVKHIYFNKILLGIFELPSCYHQLF